MRSRGRTQLRYSNAANNLQNAYQKNEFVEATSCAITLRTKTCELTKATLNTISLPLLLLSSPPPLLLCCKRHALTDAREQHDHTPIRPTGTLFSRVNELLPLRGLEMRALGCLPEPPTQKKRIGAKTIRERQTHKQYNPKQKQTEVLHTSQN